MSSTGIPAPRTNTDCGDIDRMNDVHVRDGKLQTSDGTELKPTETFVTEPEKPIEPVHRERLERRPADEANGAK